MNFCTGHCSISTPKFDTYRVSFLQLSERGNSPGPEQGLSALYLLCTSSPLKENWLLCYIKQYQYFASISPALSHLQISSLNICLDTVFGNPLHGLLVRRRAARLHAYLLKECSGNQRHQHDSLLGCLSSLPNCATAAIDLRIWFCYLAGLCKTQSWLNRIPNPLTGFIRSCMCY